MRASSVEGLHGLVYIYNIPPEYHACDLRRFFSQCIEASGFTCFHFRHRKELLLSSLPRESLNISSSSMVSLIQQKNRRIKTSSIKLCCLVTLPHIHIGEFIRSYTGMHWFSTTDDLPLPDRCLISHVHIDDAEDMSGRSEVHLNEILILVISKLIELKPPEWMPQGNVGTPTLHFFNLIKCCQLDSSIIKKLKLDFCKSKQRTYCAVPYDYGGSNSQKVVAANLLLGELRTQTGLRIMCEDEYLESQSLTDVVSYVKSSSKDSQLSAASDKLSDDDDIDEPAEDWERFESLHDDPYKVERGDKANIKYEDKVELVWEKGGSGLVFHTDEYTWRKLDPLRKEEFFDEPASLDWDIDMDAYESPQHFSVGPTPTGHWGMTRDTSDLIDMGREKDTFEHQDSSKDQNSRTHNKVWNDYSLRLMRRMGWLPGCPAGASKRPGPSLTDILPSPSLSKVKELPHKGLGYHGPRLHPSLSYDHLPRETCSTRSVYIRTAFDRPSFAKSRTETTWQWPRLPDRQDLKRFDAPPDGDDLPSLQRKRALLSVRSRTIILSPNDTLPLSKEGITFVSGGWLRPVNFRVIPPRQCV